MIKIIFDEKNEVEYIDLVKRIYTKRILSDIDTYSKEKRCFIHSKTIEENVIVFEFQDGNKKSHNVGEIADVIVNDKSIFNKNTGKLI